MAYQYWEADLQLLACLLLHHINGVGQRMIAIVCCYLVMGHALNTRTWCVEAIS